VLDADPGACEELRRLPAVEGGLQAITQSAVATGDGARVVQVAGGNNSVTTG
jgi:hypothetical protein